MDAEKEAMVGTLREFPVDVPDLIHLMYGAINPKAGCFLNDLFGESYYKHLDSSAHYVQQYCKIGCVNIWYIYL